MITEISEYTPGLRCPCCKGDAVMVLAKNARSYSCECADCIHTWHSNARAVAKEWERVLAKQNSENGW